MRYFFLIICLVGFLNSFSQLTVSITNFTDVTCFGNCDGTATVGVTGGTPPYTYIWSNGATTQTATNLCAGTITVDVFDSSLNTDSTSVLISTSSILSVSLNTIQEDTCATCIGIVNANVGGGLPPFTYLWANGDTGITATNLCGGYIDVLVLDSLGCIGMDSTNINIIGTPACPQLQFGVINGRVYNDLNANCTQEGGEDGLSNIMLEALPGSYYATTNLLGDYSFNIPYGNYTIAQVPQAYINEVCPVGGSYSLVLDSINNSLPNNNFGDTISGVQDVSITLIGSNIVPGFITSYYMQYTSLNTTPMNGTVYLIVDDSLSFMGSSIPPSNISGDTIFWTYSNLLQFENRYITAQYQVPPNVNLLGDTMSACAYITPLIGDVAPANNTSCTNMIVVGSYDPNDKRVEPAGDGPTGDILITENVMDYTIRFQNSGTLFATNVVVVDTLSSTLNVATLRNVSASHPFTYDVTGQGIITFSFINIMLPDSNVDEPGSHGAIHFTIDQNTANTVGTVIENTAHIYFDFNPAIVTNTATNTIVAPTIVRDVVNVTPNSYIFPNPTSDVLYIDAVLKTQEVKILDVAGKLVKLITPQSNSVNVSELPTGIYFIQLINKNKTITRKFVKQ
jgi:hypothetical protein